ncbi:uncharacterized protein LOC9640052 isoform X2 [Selaginella moellendorffii]|nr:uncharacterized protein LOC9640052 isoform X2 [Selaginella moellendorffii]|eukprot:XP_024532355.1 uncharacterized protein LOC9640052 isoform X2 [Selaginella moellendorffii]
MVGYSLKLGAMPQRPAWLEALLTEKFFVACPSHSTIKKNERNVFCVDCSYGICQHCLPAHQSHRLLQVRRYVYHDVIRLQDIQKFVDCALVQTYIINSARVVFLNQRPQPRPSRGFGNSCETCERSLQDAYRYCSLACKVDAVVRRGKDLSSLAPRQGASNAQPDDFFVLSPAESLKSDSDEEMSPNSVLEDANSSSPTSSGSSGDDEEDSISCDFGESAAARTSMFVNPNPPMKKFRSHRSTTAAKFLANIGGSSGSSSSSKHRKGVPHRSPL